MPLFDYGCRSCGEEFTELRKGSEKDDPLACPQCGAMDTQREVSAFAFGSSSGSSTPSSGPSCGSSGFS